MLAKKMNDRPIGEITLESRNIGESFLIKEPKEVRGRHSPLHCIGAINLKDAVLRIHPGEEAMMKRKVLLIALSSTSTVERVMETLEN